jgi:putative transposase
MYAYRQATLTQREELLSERQCRRWPWHAPPHFADGENLYLLTAACYDHRPLLASGARRDEFLTALFDLVSSMEGDLRAWVVLPNHYHMVARVDLAAFAARVGRLHNGKATQWNREDGTPGRKVWHRFSDRRIRSDRHYFATLNYVHANPVRHGLAADATQWPWNSVAHYLREAGREVLAGWWRDYPVDGYGDGWDEP